MQIVIGLLAFIGGLALVGMIVASLGLLVAAGRKEPKP